jgi:hypothetical protein
MKRVPSLGSEPTPLCVPHRKSDPVKLVSAKQPERVMNLRGNYAARASQQS